MVMIDSCGTVPPAYVALKGITHGVYYIYINLGILPLCTEMWNDTRYMGKPLYMCLVSNANWWKNDVSNIDFVYHLHILNTYIYNSINQ